MVANNQPETQQTKPACLLAIDPGLSYTGYGLYQMSDLDPKQSAHLINYGVIKGGKSKGINKAPAIWGIMLKMMLVTKPFSFVIEMPEVHKSRKGQQAMQKGSTTKLAFLVGGLVHAYYVHTRGMSLHPYNVTLPAPMIFTPTQWKGNISKEAHRRQCNEIYKLDLQTSIEENISDALMLGKHVLDAEGITLIGGVGSRKDV